MYTKKNARLTFKSHKRSGYKRNNNFSNGKGRNKGNLTQQYNKFLKLAKEAFTSGDRIQSEYYYQFTDHYYRLMVELGINIEDNEISLENKVKETKEYQETQSEIEQDTSLEKNNPDNNKNTEVKPDDDSLESIESVPFIAEPAKKKRVTTSK